MFVKFKLSLLLILSIFLASCGKKTIPIIYVEGSCYVDRIDGLIKNPDGQYVGNAGETINVWGWAADTKSGKVPKIVNLILAEVGGETFNFGSSEVGAKRPDVAAVFGRPELVNSGFRVEGKLNTQPGSYSVQLVADYQNKIVVCAPNALLKVR